MTQERKKMRKEDQRGERKGVKRERRREDFFLNGHRNAGVFLLHLPQIDESCPIIETGSLLSDQSDTYSSLASIYAARLDTHMGA